MPLDRPLTAEDILLYQPSEEQKKHGFRTYASRLMVEGVRFEKAGNELQAKLRYEKCKAYCKLRGVAFPPFSEGKTALMEAVEQAQEPTKEWVRGEDVVKARPTKNNPTGLKPKVPKVPGKPGRPKGSKNKPAKRSWSGDREACKAKGQMIWFNRLLAHGETEAAAAFAHRHNLPVAGQLSVARTIVSGEPKQGEIVSTFIQHPATELPSSDGVTGNQQERTGHLTALPPPSEPLSFLNNSMERSLSGDGSVVISGVTRDLSAANSNGSLEPSKEGTGTVERLGMLSLREQLMRQLAEMDAAEKAAGIPQVSPAVIQPEVNPVADEPLKDTAKFQWTGSPQTYEDCVAYAAAMPKVEVVFQPPNPKPLAVVPAPLSAPEPVKQPVTALPNSPAGTRPAVVSNFVVNPRLVRVRFTDTPEGAPIEYASMLIERVGMRPNEKLDVYLVEGKPGINAIYRETKKRT